MNPKIEIDFYSPMKGFSSVKVGGTPWSGTATQEAVRRARLCHCLKCLDCAIRKVVEASEKGGI